MDQMLLIIGFVVFLVGLLTGFALPKLANPRMGLSSHVGTLMNGMFLILLGLVWSRLDLSALCLQLVFWFAIYAAVTTWLATFVAALLNAGGSMMAIAAPERIGTPGRESFIKFLLVTGSIVLVVAIALVLAGLIRA